MERNNDYDEESEYQFIPSENDTEDLARRHVA